MNFLLISSFGPSICQVEADWPFFQKKKKWKTNAQYHGTNLKVECPKGSGDMLNLAAVADEIQHRIIHIFARDAEGRRACNGGLDRLDKDPFFRNHVFFHEVSWSDSNYA